MARVNPVASFVSDLGASTVVGLENFGRFWGFAGHAMSCIPMELVAVRGWRRFLPQCFAIA